MNTGQQSVDKLVRFIEENIRASGRAGLRFVDPRNHLSRAVAKQNNIIFGRRGAGKSSLLSTLAKQDESVSVRVNLEDLKGITFPNILIQILLQVLDSLVHEVCQRSWFISPARWRIRRRGNELINLLRRRLTDDDIEEMAVRDRQASRASLGLTPGAASASLGADSEVEVSKTIQRDKLVFMQTLLPDLKSFIVRVGAVLGNRPVFLVLDDFYFVRKAEQPHCIDYFHRLTKDTDLFLKVATIKHRSRIYSRGNGPPIGVELGADVLELDLDYTLDRFNDLQSFMRQLLVDAAEDAKVELEIDDLFAGQGFTQLCLASGGVPRDFLNLFAKLGSRIAAGEIDRIGKVDVNETAIEASQGKFSALSDDAGSDRGVLEHYLDLIKAYVYSTKRTNAFLISKPRLNEHPMEAQAIRELVDLRFLHLADGNISAAPSDGLRYEAYMLDVGLYDNSRPRDFNQIEPASTDDRSRKDDLRASPRLDLAKLHEGLVELDTQIELELSDFGRD